MFYNFTEVVCSRAPTWNLCCASDVQKHTTCWL